MSEFEVRYEVEKAKAKTASLWSCTKRSWKLVNEGTRQVVDFDCRSWNCAVHGSTLRWRWKLRLGSVPWAHFWTITQVPEDPAIATKSWRVLRDWLRSNGVRTYLRVLELGAGGMRHYHLLTEGENHDMVVPVGWHTKDCIATIGCSERCTDPNRRFQAWASEAVGGIGYGPILDVSRVRSGSGSVQYLLGYVTKGGMDHADRYRGYRRAVVSRNIPSWEMAEGLLNRNAGRDSVRSGSWELWR